MLLADMQLESSEAALNKVLERTERYLQGMKHRYSSL